jgi:transposase
MSDRFDNRFKRKLESDADRNGHGASNVRRIELITGTGQRRRWSSDDKARIVEESLRPGANVSEIARRNGLSPSMSFFKQKVAKLRHRAKGAALHS